MKRLQDETQWIERVFTANFSFKWWIVSVQFDVTILQIVLTTSTPPDWKIERKLMNKKTMMNQSDLLLLRTEKHWINWRSERNKRNCLNIFLCQGKSNELSCLEETFVRREEKDEALVFYSYLLTDQDVVEWLEKTKSDDIHSPTRN